MRAFHVLGFLLAAILVASCSDDAPTNNPGGNNGGTGGSGSFKNEASATVNGVQWSSTSVAATRNDGAGLVVITFVAYGANGSHLDLGLANASTKSFTIDGGVVQADFVYEGKSFGHNHNATGTIVVTELTTTGIRGTFDIAAQTSTGEAGTAVGSFEATF